MEIKSIRLLANRILVCPVEEETARGFIIPEQYRSFRTGIVRAVGNGPRLKNGTRRPIPIQVGDSIVLSDDYRMPVDIEGKEHFIVSDEKVLCVLANDRTQPPVGFRLLVAGERVRKGDVYTRNGSTWHETRHPGGKWNPHGYWPMARRTNVAGHSPRE